MITSEYSFFLFSILKTILFSNQDMQNHGLKNYSFVAMDVKTVCYEIGSKILSRIEMKICNAKYTFCVNFFGFIYCSQQKDPYGSFCWPQ